MQIYENNVGMKFQLKAPLNHVNQYCQELATGFR